MPNAGGDVTAVGGDGATSGPLVVYDLAGPRTPAVVVADRSLAASIEQVRCFWDFDDPDGARLGFWGPGDVVVASFPGWHRADCELARLPDGWIPLPGSPGERWEDLDQTWFLSTVEHGGWVYIFQSDLELLTSQIAGTVQAQPGAAPGFLLVDGIDATFFRIPVVAFRQAWAQAQGQARRMVAGRGGSAVPSP